MDMDTEKIAKAARKSPWSVLVIALGNLSFAALAFSTLDDKEVLTLRLSGANAWMMSWAFLIAGAVCLVTFFLPYNRVLRSASIGFLTLAAAGRVALLVSPFVVGNGFAILAWVYITILQIVLWPHLLPPPRKVEEFIKWREEGSPERRGGV